MKTNLKGGDDGDFFASSNTFSNRRRFTLFLCNPPWLEPSGDEALSSDSWAEAAGLPRSRRQLAADFAQHAIDALADNGRFCLILPASLLLASTSADFIRGWLMRARLTRVINFSDQRELIFKSASHACVVVSGVPRRNAAEANWIPINESFEYWCPKADVSLLFGRLTLNSGDRHEVQTQAVLTNHQCLVTLMWGSSFDIALWARLRLYGTFSDMFSGRKARWRQRKGFHHLDKSASPVSSRPLHKYGFLPVDALHGPLPVLDASLVQSFPAKEIRTVASKLTPSLFEVFEGPRIIFPDGPSPDLEIRAAFTDKDCSFKNSIGALVGPEADEDLLRFTAVYLRSDLVSYFLLTQAYQVLSERHRVTLRDIGGFPFMPPERHPNPGAARQIIAKVAEVSRRIEATPPLMQEQFFRRERNALQSLIYRYFDLTKSESKIVREAVNDLLPSVQPRGFKSIYTPLQYHAETKRLERYACRLQEELEAWRDTLGGRGTFDVSVVSQPTEQAGPLGIVRVTLRTRATADGAPTVEESDRLVQATLKRLRQDGLLPMELGGGLYFAADAIIRSENSVYLIKPRVRRFWLERTALLDADRLVGAVRKVERSDGRAVA